ncbi:uncharacterized protein BDR25DRAFT_360677 [Lindgomyces ingoldianus]|uniref:Uncharacterized protein n=1 Tax=Lindgomyces ingoldianus TaxID=673940 RepID=A0ACB6QEN0_9PLEO|nr:uncharacterized protein BDR25DRAFT_360677 [Lindgomyces ingoldianus]KAF2465315.1 hypothetical protein BDR25DRAFT_360677 [Lindgomyces ingoldianus]
MPADFVHTRKYVVHGKAHFVLGFCFLSLSEFSFSILPENGNSRQRLPSSEVLEHRVSGSGGDTFSASSITKITALDEIFILLGFFLDIALGEAVIVFSARNEYLGEHLGGQKPLGFFVRVPGYRIDESDYLAQDGKRGIDQEFYMKGYGS